MADVEATLTGPDTITLVGRSLAGPFSFGRTLALEEIAVPLLNAGVAEVTLGAPLLEPLRHATTGAAVAGGLAARIDPAPLAPGASTVVRLGGTAPARPGRYGTTLRLGALTVPVKVEIGASTLWGIGLMLLGLGAVGLTTVLATENTLRAKRAEVLALQQRLHEREEQDPFPARLAGDVQTLEGDYAIALAALSAPTPASFADHRLADAAAPLAEAAAIWADISKQVSGRKPGEAEIADLLASWQVYNDITTDIARQIPAAPGSPSSAQAVAADLPALLDDYRARFIRRFLPTQISYDRLQLDQVVLGVRLAAASGRAAEAHQRATAAQQWIDRGLDALAGTRELVEGSTLLGFNLASNARQVERTLTEEPQPSEVAAAIRAKLDRAAQTLAAAAGKEHEEDLAFAAANRLVSEAQTDLTRVRAQEALRDYQAAMDAANAATGIEDVDAAVEREQAQPHGEPAQKVAGLRRIMAVWASKIAAMPDPAARPALQSDEAAVMAALDKGDLTGSVGRYQSLINAWTDWATRYGQAEAAKSLQPRCARDKVLASVQVAQLNEELRQMRPRPERDGWVNRLAALAAQVDGFEPAADFAGKTCTHALFDITTALLNLSKDMFQVETMDAKITPTARQSALRQLGLGAIASGPRKLTLTTATPPADLVLNRDLRLALAGEDRSWLDTSTVRIDFADGTPPVVTTLGALQHQAGISHRFAAPPTGLLHATITAPATSDRDRPELLGEGTLALAVKPSPVSTMQSVADAFFNAHFALALAIAGTIYLWRFHSGKKVFGEAGFDYVEAFAVGFAVNGAIANLPAELSHLVAH